MAPASFCHFFSPAMSDHVVAEVDRLVIESCANGFEEATDGGFARLYSAAFPRVYSFIRSQVSNTQTAQDIVSRVFLKAYKHHHKAPSGEAGLHWMFRIAYTTLVDYQRVDGRRESVSISMEDLADVAGESVRPDTAYAAKERKALLLSVVSELDKDDRSIVALKFMGQRTNREIAKILGISEGAASMRLLRALRRVRERLLEMGITP